MTAKFSNSKKVFILGAGSSASYGLPTGEDLKRIILSKDISDFYKSINLISLEEQQKYYLNRDSLERFYLYLRVIFISHRGTKCAPIQIPEFGEELFYIEQFDAFRKKFSRSGSMTIDSFVSQNENTEIKEIAKIFVILIIAAFSCDEIFKPNSNDDWIGYSIHRNIDWNADFENDLPSIISFNYDNLFMTKLYNYISELHGKSRATSIIQKINITHIYGHLEQDLQYDLETKDKKALYHYLTTSLIPQNLNKINFIRGNSNSTTEISTLLNGSKEIFILGYGFDRFNNQILFERLSTLQHLLNDSIKGITGFGLPDFIKRSIDNSLIGIDPSLALNNDFKCRELLVQTMSTDLFPIK